MRNKGKAHSAGKRIAGEIRPYQTTIIRLGYFIINYPYILWMPLFKVIIEVLNFGCISYP